MNHDLYAKMMKLLIDSGLPEQVVIATVVQLAEDVVTDKKEAEDREVLRDMLAGMLPTF